MDGEGEKRREKGLREQKPGCDGFLSFRVLVCLINILFRDIIIWLHQLEMLSDHWTPIEIWVWMELIYGSTLSFWQQQKNLGVNDQSVIFND